MKIVIIPECTGVHAIREDGKVVNTKTGRVLKTNISMTGYERLSITLGKGKLYSASIHRLLAEAFIPNDDITKDTVNHKDGNKLNNSLSNLEWCSNADNIRHAFSSGLHPKHRRHKDYDALIKRNSLMIDMYLSSSSSMRAIGKAFGLKETQAKKILKGLVKPTTC